MHGICLVIVRYAKDMCSSFSYLFYLNFNNPISGTPEVSNHILVSLIVIQLLDKYSGFYRSST